MQDGIININKEAGYTSHDVVAKMRGILSVRRIGHTGTLDPDATGVLPICIGQATKLCDLLTDKTKTYRATMLLGTVTDTQDITGSIIGTYDVSISEDEVRQAISSFVGEIDQIPPMYSAIKVNGRKLYDLAREGIEVERKPRRIHIYSIDVDSIKLPEVVMTIKCSKGTYIRTICNDIGTQLGCGGCMKNLVRTQVSGFSIEDALKLEEVEKLKAIGELDQHITPIDAFFDDIEEKYIVMEDYNKYALNGNTLKAEFFNLTSDIFIDQSKIKVYDKDNKFLGIYQWNSNEKIFKPWKLFIGGRK